MNVLGIIAEYNPFHKGHQYHIEQSKVLTNADYTIVVMSGSFTQRGGCAIADKYTRAKAALECGADLVLELPVLYSLASAEYFAKGAVCLLDSLGVVTHLSFGCESTDMKPMKKIANLLADEPEEYKKFLKAALSTGYSYPMAREDALGKMLPELFMDHTEDSHFSMRLPNTILGIEYCKALLQCKSSITPIAVKRRGSSHHQLETDMQFSSAASLRQQLSDTCIQYTKPQASLEQESLIPQVIRLQLPDASTQALTQACQKSFPLFDEDFSSLVRFTLIRVPNHDYTPYLDVTEALSNRIQTQLFAYESFHQFAALLKTKELTYTRICRCLFHILLGITWEDMHQAAVQEHRTYIRVLGMKERASQLLHDIRTHSALPIITNPAKSPAPLSPVLQRILELDTTAAHIYNAAAGEKFHQTTACEYTRPFLKIP